VTGTFFKAVWIETAEEAGKPIPPPQYRPVIYQTRQLRRSSCTEWLKDPFSMLP
jgi:hypothetical protein